MCWLQKLKQYVRRVYHPFLSQEYAVQGGQPLAIIFLDSFAADAAGDNLGEMTCDAISRRNLESSGRFQQQFKIEVWSAKQGGELPPDLQQAFARS